MHGLSYAFLGSRNKIESNSAEIFETDEGLVNRSSHATSGRRRRLPRGTRNFLDGLPSATFVEHDLGAQSQELLRKLALRLRSRTGWPDKLMTKAGVFAQNSEDNPKIPAGYTYLLQLIAHDIIASSISFGVARGGKLDIENARLVPLSLATIYGSGPDTHPHVYQFSRMCRASQGKLPRTFLRVGRSREEDPAANCPFKDIGRGTAIGVSDTGFNPGVNDLNTEAFLADPRNDDHVIISQLTLLFHKLHNTVLATIEDKNPSAASAGSIDAKLAYENFFAARAIVTLIYRKIVLYDALEHLLHPAVYKYYVKEEGVRIDGGQDVPLEFAVGAFRCGHAMVRDSYQFTKDNTPERTKIALKISSLRVPQELPISGKWIVDWNLFFDTGNPVLNFSQRIGPMFATAIDDSRLFPPQNEELDTHGLPVRDIRSASAVPVWSVPDLIVALREHANIPNIERLLHKYETYREPLRKWLISTSGNNGSAVAGSRILDDPPLPFFVLFEAACVDPTATDGLKTFKDGGQHLGPLGSIIVAETILGLLDNASGNGTFEPLKEQIDGVCKVLNLDKSLFADVDEIQSMPALLDYLKNESVIPA